MNRIRRKKFGYAYAADAGQITKLVSENTITKFSEFIMNEKLVEDIDVIDYLYSLKNPDINGFVNDFISDRSRREEYIEDILLEIGDTIEDEKYDWISKELKKF